MDELTQERFGTLPWWEHSTMSERLRRRLEAARRRELWAALEDEPATSQVRDSEVA